MTILNEDGPLRVLKNVEVGEGTRIFNFVNAYGCKIGKESKVGSFVEIQKGSSIGSRCKISSHSFICEGVHIGNNVFVGHSVTFTNDRFPKATNPDGSVQTEEDWTLEETRVEDFVSIGSGATIMCGITLGEGCLVGAGAVVTKSVEPRTVVAGNPARFIKKLD